jgi:hypothetical protein
MECGLVDVGQSLDVQVRDAFACVEAMPHLTEDLANVDWGSRPQFPNESDLLVCWVELQHELAEIRVQWNSPRHFNDDAIAIRPDGAACADSSTWNSFARRTKRNSSSVIALAALGRSFSADASLMSRTMFWQSSSRHW